MSHLTEMVPKVPADLASVSETAEDILQFCEVILSLFDFSVDAWLLPVSSFSPAHTILYHCR